MTKIKAPRGFRLVRRGRRRRGDRIWCATCAAFIVYTGSNWGPFVADQGWGHHAPTFRRRAARKK